jgi:hypothetical protein
MVGCAHCNCYVQFLCAGNGWNTLQAFPEVTTNLAHTVIAVLSLEVSPQMRNSTHSLSEACMTTGAPYMRASSRHAQVNPDPLRLQMFLVQQPEPQTGKQQSASR